MPGGKNIHFLRNHGYTIVEVMIVLAISTGMFVLAANFINGKQERTAFPQAVNEFTAQLQNMATDVADGKYSDVAIHCNIAGTEVKINSGVSTDTDPNTDTGTQGANADCVFRGKLAHFYDKDKYEVIPLVDLRSSSSESDEDNSLLKVKSHADLVQQETIPQHLEVVQTYIVKAVDGLTENGNNIGFVQSLGVNQYDDDHNLIGFKAGSQTVNMVYSNGMPDTAAVPDYDSIAGTLNIAKSVTICLTDGVQFASVVVGGNANGELTFNQTLTGSATCER